MKIVVVNTFDKGGGAERIASTLVDGLRERGHEVSFLCGQAHRSDSRAMMGKLDWVLGRTIKRIGYADAISLAAYRFLQYSEVRDADVIHFHNLHGFYFGLKMLPKIIAAKPCVWTLHDCWPLTGGCYWQMNMNCKNWLSNCKPCPSHGIHPMTGIFDTAAPMLSLKRKLYEAMVRHGGIITGVSEWMTNQIQQAFNTVNLDTNCINCLPNSIEIPADETKRPILPAIVPTFRPIVLLVAANVTYPQKGMSTALGALQRNMDMDYTLLTVGTPFPRAVLLQYGLADRTVQLGYISDREMLTTIYGAAKVTIVPSLAESFCLVAAESIACGTPVVASDVTALPDLVRVGQTGFLAKVNDMEDFASKMRIVFEMTPEDYCRLSNSAKEFARQNFISLPQWLDSYVTLYKKAISNHT